MVTIGQLLVLMKGKPIIFLLESLALLSLLVMVIVQMASLSVASKNNPELGSGPKFENFSKNVIDSVIAISIYGQTSKNNNQILTIKNLLK